MTITLSDIQRARIRIHDAIYDTPFIRLRSLESELGCIAYAKCENMQRTHSFKIRGALNAILHLDKDTQARGVVASSSGNHGQAVSFVARLLNIPCVIVVPDTASDFKVNKIRQNRAEIQFCNVEERFKVSTEISKERNMTLIPPFDHVDVMAGQGTIGLEILESTIPFTHVVVPTSGGGLLSGISVALKESGISVIGAEPERLPRYSESLRAKSPVTVPTQSTVADALVVNKPGTLPFEVIQSLEIDVVPVGEDSMLNARTLIQNDSKMILEVSSSIGIAAVLERRLTFNEDDVVCFIISGGNTEI